MSIFKQNTGEYVNSLPNFNSELEYQNEIKRRQEAEKSAASMNEAALQDRSTFAFDYGTVSNNKFAQAANNEKILTEHYVVDKLSKIFVNALVLDESYVQEHSSLLKKQFKNFLLEANIGLEELKTMISESSLYTQYILSEACKKAKKGAKKIAEDEELDIDDLLGDDDDGDFDLDEDANGEEVAEIIKEKVIGVIEKETEFNEQQKELVDAVMTAKENGSNAKIVSESVNNHNSLYKSLMVNNYKTIINETVEREEGLNGASSLSESGEISVDMESVMLESVLQYTAMELLNTTKMKNYTIQELREMSDILSYSKNANFQIL